MVRQGPIRFSRPDSELIGTCSFHTGGEVWTVSVANATLADESLATVPDTPGGGTDLGLDRTVQFR
jgi:hypothetical protein